MGWQKVPFEQINEYSAIPTSIDVSTRVKKKTPASIMQEYEVEKWGELKNLSKRLTLKEHHRLGEKAHAAAGHRLCFFEEEIYLAPGYEISCEYVNRLVTILRQTYIKNNCNSIVELGVGYGRVLIPLMLSLGVEKVNKIHALDYTDAALEILKNVLRDSSFNIDLRRIDLGKSIVNQDLPFCDSTMKPLIFSSQALMYVPTLQPHFIDLMRNWHRGVFSFIEPSVFNLPTSSLKLLQERYIYVNDYNTNLGEMLTEASEKGFIKNFTIRADILSENVFLPLQSFNWRF